MNPLRVIALAYFCVAASAVAHPISMSNTVANCRENEVLVEMRVMLEDLVLFHGLKANSDKCLRCTPTLAILSHATDYSILHLVAELTPLLSNSGHVFNY